MPSIPVQTPLGYIGVFFVIAGIFLIIAGFDILKLEKLTITAGRKTWVTGLFLAIIGLMFLSPDIGSIIRGELGWDSKKGTFFSQELDSNQVMFVSSGQLQIGDTYCGRSSDQICILLYQATHPLTVTVESLDPQNYFVKVIDNRSPQEILDDEMVAFWQPPNCLSGCLRATYMIFKDGQLIRLETMVKP